MRAPEFFTVVVTPTFALLPVIDQQCRGLSIFDCYRWGFLECRIYAGSMLDRL